ncbi:MAG: lipoprotein signal peptidase [Bacteroidetes bacterium]|nr:MAG: lipoprotein signal peptidase [Bacteroidota bacterium]
MLRRLFRNPVVIVALVLLIDQATKIWVKTHMRLGEEIPVFDHWFLIHFTENNGMAFGMEFGGNYGKVFLSIFRVVAVFGLGYYLYYLNRKKAPTGLIVSFSLILAGALGNIIDSLFYGIIFSDSFHGIAQLFPENGGYAPFLHGKVVDMLYFPILKGTFPEWLPIWGGQEFLFFRPVFNIADSAITIGVAMILLFQKRYFSEHQPS